MAFLAQTMYDYPMKVQRVYIDTSVLGGCFEVEFTQWSNALMNDFRTGRLKPVLSKVVEAEVQDAPESVQTLYIELVLELYL